MTERPFEALGLSADADRAYPLLIATRGVAAGELAGTMGVARERAVSACEELARRGLVRVGRDGLWYPLPPHSEFVPMLARAQEQLRRGRDLLDRLGLEYRRVHEGRRAEDLVRVVEGAAAMAAEIEALHACARDEVLVFAGGCAPPPAAPRKGVRARAVLERAATDSAGAFGAARLRVAERLPVPLRIADRSRALLLPAQDGGEFAAYGGEPPYGRAVLPHGADEGGRDAYGSDGHGADASGPDAYGADVYGSGEGGPDAWRADGHGPDACSFDVHGPDVCGPGLVGPDLCGPDAHRPVYPPAAVGDPVMVVVGPGPLLDALVALFESVWASAVPLATPHTPLRLRILGMLVTGSTDAAMARALGVAVRTVQRHISAMERAAGVDNRLQLVWHAARHGWLDG